MNPWETLTMSQKEAPRIGLLKALVAGRVIGREVATALGVTVRQVWRLKRRFESAGAEGLLHRGRGRPSPILGALAACWASAANGAATMPPVSIAIKVRRSITGSSSKCSA